MVNQSTLVLNPGWDFLRSNALLQGHLIKSAISRLTINYHINYYHINYFLTFLLVCNKCSMGFIVASI
jgi:hypothetical protein